MRCWRRTQPQSFASRRCPDPGVYPANRDKANFWLESIFDLDLTALASVGVRGVLFDVDNTLVAPLHDRMSPLLVEHLLQQRQRAGIERWALASNSHRDLSPLAQAIEADIVRATWLVAKPRAAYFRRALSILAMKAEEVAMIGDKILHDIEPAARLGMRTVLVRPLANDQTVDRVLLRRRRERTARLAIEQMGTPHGDIRTHARRLYPPNAALEQTN
jgi:HAD superfamily phosphatase (TIGR01668 family)